MSVLCTFVDHESKHHRICEVTATHRVLKDPMQGELFLVWYVLNEDEITTGTVYYGPEFCAEHALLVARQRNEKKTPRRQSPPMTPAPKRQRGKKASHDTD